MKAILFDIDGTLVDSNYLHIEAWSQAFADLGVEVDAWRIHRGIGMDSELLLDTLLGDAADSLRDKASELHASYYAESRSRLRPFSLARDLLSRLSDAGMTVVLATSAPEKELAALRDVLKVEDSIAVVTSAEDVEQAKPAPDIVEVALKRASVDASDAIMVGDSVWDMNAATEAGVASVGVRSSGVSDAELFAAGALAVYDDVAELFDKLDDSPVMETAN